MIRADIPHKPTMNIDLHCHSNVSDGLLSPSELVCRAREKGVAVLALTDHDDVGGLVEARAAARIHGMRLIDGVEISVTWRTHTIHVVGLHIDAHHPRLCEGLRGIRHGRIERAKRIAMALGAHGIKDALEGAYAFAGNPQLIGRMHFARFLVEAGHARNLKAVFKKFLVKGKPGYSPHQWAELGEALRWIRAAGGIAVLAHPGRYDMGAGTMRELLAEFKALGGGGIEVVTGSHRAEQFPVFAKYSVTYGFLASRGSDYHGPGESFTELGGLPELPAMCEPVWRDWL